jgi:hypothetical protein
MRGIVRLTTIRLYLAIYFLRLPKGKAIKRLHGANCAELFGIWEAESASSFNA